MRLGTKIKKTLKPYYRDEQTGLFTFLVCRLIVELNTMRYCLQNWKLRRLNKSSIAGLKKTRAKSVFVFANGPSLNDLDFVKVKAHMDTRDYDLITVNSFASKGIDQYGLKPAVAVFGDTMHYRDEDDAQFTEQAADDIRAINEHGVSALVPYHYFKRSRFKESIPYCGVYNVYRNNVDKTHKPLGFYRVTAFYALALALDVGYENVYLCGYDNSYFRTFEVDLNNEKYFDNKHFYEEKQTRLHLPTEKYGPTSHIFYDTYRHFKYLEKINKNSRGESKLYNIAKTTFTDAFERNFGLDVYKDDQ